MLLQGAGAEHFVLAEGFEGGGRHVGDGNRVAQGIEEFDGIAGFKRAGTFV